jgi:hypothetical protein
MYETPVLPAQSDAWLSAALGAGIGAYVDRVVNAPQTLANNTAYGMGADGKLYLIGQPVGTVSTTVGASSPAHVSPLMLLLVLGAVLMASHH